jgi:transcriptional regulator GlxA family with amidase domain
MSGTRQRPRTRHTDRPLRPPERAVEPDLRVGFVLSPNFTLLAFAGFVEALRHAADESDRSRQIYCSWTCLGADLAPVRASCGVEMRPWEVYGDPARFDYLVVVGGLLSDFRQHAPETFAFIRLAAEQGVTLVGLCTGSFALAEAGLLDGRRCAVHLRHRQELIDLYPEVIPVSDERYVIDGKIITCPGGTAAIDLAVALIGRHCGEARALKGLAQMIVSEHQAAQQRVRSPYEDLANCGDWRVERAIELMQQNIGEPLSIEGLARVMGTTVRQLDRAFGDRAKLPPAAFWREMRLQHARWRLLNSSRTVTQIAHECGFADCAHLSRWFRRSFNESPRNYRRRRRQAAAALP